MKHFSKLSKKLESTSYNNALNYPEFIYHYTNIESLALILKSQSFRFNAISKLDDLTEGIADDVGYLSSFALISCWTDKKEENIALWNMYCDSGKGIRIKMRPTLFGEETIEESSDKFYSINNLELFYPVNFLFKIKYVDSIRRTIRGNKIGSLDIRELGKLKHEIWKFQNEWRFIIYQFPDNTVFHKLINNELAEIKNVLSEYEFKHSHYDLKIVSSEFSEMEIMLGPDTSKSEQIIVESLIKNYNPKASIRLSELKGKVSFK